jgi:membrane associated rhomboid family serine protease
MIPLRDDNPTKTVAFVTIAIIAANIFVFIHELMLPSPAHVQAFFADFALVPAEVARASSAAAYETVFTSMFLHGSWLHIIGNMWFLWIFGDNVEDSVGHFKFIVFYLLCGIGAAAAQVAISPNSNIPMIGASGAISGVLGAYLLVFPRARVLVLFPIWIFWRIFYVPAVVMLGLWFLLQAFSGLAVAGADVNSGGVAFWAHIGGFVAGIALIPLFKKRGVRLFQ